MTALQQVIAIAIIAAATMLTRLLPFIIYPEGRPVPGRVHYLGKMLPAAAFGLLVVYCLRNIRLTAGTHGIPEAVGIGVTALLHVWKKNMLLSIAGGTILYMVLVQTVF